VLLATKLSTGIVSNRLATTIILNSDIKKNKLITKNNSPQKQKPIPRYVVQHYVLTCSILQKKVKVIQCNPFFCHSKISCNSKHEVEKRDANTGFPGGLGPALRAAAAKAAIDSKDTLVVGVTKYNHKHNHPPIRLRRNNIQWARS
jgi:hypothetical protein